MKNPLTVFLILFSIILLFSGCRSSPSTSETETEVTEGSSEEVSEEASEADSPKENADSGKLPFWGEKKRLRQKDDLHLKMTSIEINDTDFTTAERVARIYVSITFQNVGEVAVDLEKWTVFLKAVNDPQLRATVKEDPLDVSLDPGSKEEFVDMILVFDPGFSKFTDAGGDIEEGVLLENVVEYSTEEKQDYTFVVSRHKIIK